MFAFIQGKLFHSSPSSITINCNGIGYQIMIPLSTFQSLPPLGQEILLHTSFVVREQSQALYGFLNPDECKLFERLLNINGIGPKTALNLIGHLPTPLLEEAIHNNDLHSLCKVPGIGKKTAQRLLIEMKDKISITPHNNKLRDALSALINLGYNQATAEKALQKTPHTEDLATLITLALKHV